jgi:sec-independent protein translocase protein TatB
MFGIGMPEMILILAVALIVIGPKKLPDLARSLGKAMGEFKKATSDLKESMQIDTELKEVKSAFNDIGKTESVKDSGEEDAPEKEKLADEAEIEIAEEDDAAKSGDSMEQLKAAFDRRSQDQADPVDAAPVDTEPTETDSEPESKPGKE